MVWQNRPAERLYATTESYRSGQHRSNRYYTGKVALHPPCAGQRVLSASILLFSRVRSLPWNCHRIFLWYDQIRGQIRSTAIFMSLTVAAAAGPYTRRMKYNSSAAAMTAAVLGVATSHCGRTMAFSGRILVHRGVYSMAKSSAAVGVALGIPRSVLPQCGAM